MSPACAPVRSGRARRPGSALLSVAIPGLLLLATVPAFAGNRLAGSKSRYLLEHASNPVDWYPWSTEAFEKAKREDKLVFLSIGYSTCHWCQVMDRESFSDAEVAEAMNARFVSIKVDREERPDLDSVYLNVSRTLTGEAGWPNNVILTPDGKPILVISYVPKERLLAIVTRVRAMWTDRRKELNASAEMVVRALDGPPDRESPSLGPEILARGFEDLAGRFDVEHGGFLPAPKFPRSHQLMFLLRTWRRTGEPKALAMVEKTLDAMSSGAIWDATGSGFHRYTTDAAWNEPHWEKMLYDQALLAIVHLEAYQATGRRVYAETARKTFEYVLRDLRSPAGTFFAAQDADEEYYTAVDRTRRARPRREEKILTDWNGLMVAALAFGGAVLDDRGLTSAARRAADALLKARGSGRLQHVEGQKAFLDDYAMLGWGLLNLYEASFDLRYLEAAIALEDESVRLFGDGNGRFFLTPSDGEKLLVRPREVADAAMPSGSSVQLMNLVRIARITGDARTDQRARQLAAASAGEVRLAPSESAYFLSGLGFLLGPSLEIVLSGRNPTALRRVVFRSFVPEKVVLSRPPGRAPAVTKIAPFTKSQVPIRGRTTAYVCTNHSCRLPTTDPEALKALLAP